MMFYKTNYLQVLESGKVLLLIETKTTKNKTEVKLK